MEITSFTTACRYMWILQDRDGNEFAHSAGIGRVPRHMIEEALSPGGRARGLEIWAERYGLIGRAGQELGFVPLDNDASFVEIKIPPDPGWGRKERSHYWITQEWYQNLRSPTWRRDNPSAVDPWEQERARRIAYRHEFLDLYRVRTRDAAFVGTLHECEAWMIGRRFPMLDDECWKIAMDGGVAEWPGGGSLEVKIQRIS